MPQTHVMFVPLPDRPAISWLEENPKPVDRVHGYGCNTYHMYDGEGANRVFTRMTRRWVGDYDDPLVIVDDGQRLRDPYGDGFMCREIQYKELGTGEMPDAENPVPSLGAEYGAYEL